MWHCSFDSYNSNLQIQRKETNNFIAQLNQQLNCFFLIQSLSLSRLNAIICIYFLKEVKFFKKKRKEKTQAHEYTINKTRKKKRKLSNVLNQ